MLHECKKCLKSKELSRENFYINDKMKKKYSNVCIECEIKKGKERRDRERVRLKGIIYVVYNPAWENKYKVGYTTKTIEQRLTNINIYSPLHDYRSLYTCESNDVSGDEIKIHRVLGGTFINGVLKGEWVSGDLQQIIETIEGICDKNL